MVTVLETTPSAPATRARGVAVSQFGIFYYGANALQVPFGDGYRCIGGATNRTSAINSGADRISRLALRLQGSSISTGATTRFQYWFRDPSTGATGRNLTDAHAATFVP
ncbi:MAG: hypothetical protein ACI841_001413 [Planctomycetota bacterium]|jgi:hypothetical protein